MDTIERQSVSSRSLLESEKNPLRIAGVVLALELMNLVLAAVVRAILGATTGLAEA